MNKHHLARQLALPDTRRSAVGIRNDAADDLRWSRRNSRYYFSAAGVRKPEPRPVSPLSSMPALLRLPICSHTSYRGLNRVGGEEVCCGEMGLCPRDEDMHPR